jgi:hypothetical protein
MVVEHFEVLVREKKELIITWNFTYLLQILDVCVLFGHKSEATYREINYLANFILSDLP